MDRQSVVRKAAELRGQLLNVCDLLDAEERRIRDGQQKVEALSRDRRWLEGQIMALGDLLSKWPDEPGVEGGNEKPS